MSRPILEVIALGPDDARAAESAGADRLELVADMAADGLTPARATFAAVRAAVGIPVRVMLRAGAGFSAGDGRERDALCAAAAALRSEGAEEFVMGFLDAGGGPDLPALRALLGAAGATRWTFHRAIDHAADRASLRARVGGLPGLDGYLTAGSPHGVADGLPVLTAEAAEAAARPGRHTPLLLVGGGLRAEHLPALRRAGVHGFHVGGAVRFAGWSTPIDPGAVRDWRAALDSPLEPAVAG